VRSQVCRLDAKHYIQEDSPVEISAAIKDFLGSIPSTTSLASQ